MPLDMPLDDEQDPHGECRMEIHRLNAALRCATVPRPMSEAPRTEKILGLCVGCEESDPPLWRVVWWVLEAHEDGSGCWSGEQYSEEYPVAWIPLPPVPTEIPS